MNLPVGVIVYDIDNLKIINDIMGHDKGDEIIKSVSHLLLNNREVIKLWLTLFRLFL